MTLPDLLRLGFMVRYVKPTRDPVTLADVPEMWRITHWPHRWDVPDLSPATLADVVSEWRIANGRSNGGRQEVAP